MTAPAWYGEPSAEQRHGLAILRRRPADAAFTAALAREVPAHSVSALVATYNRCPFDPAIRLADNPLYWSVTSLRRQAGEALREIVVVDDGSTDHTSDVLTHLCSAPGNIPVRSIRLPEHRGAWYARNTAARNARAPLLYLGDDDCVFAPHTVLGAVYVLTAVRASDPAAAVVNTPFYYRATTPDAVLPTHRIGQLDIEHADFATGFHAIPTTYLTDPPTLGAAAVLAPLRVRLIGGCCLIDAQALIDAGGFTDLSRWPSGYSDHLHLAADLTDARRGLYHCPDPRFGAAHLKFGAVGAYQGAPDPEQTVHGLDRRLSELIDLAAQPRRDTGHRLPDAEFLIEWIGSFFAFFAGRSPAGGRRWAARVWDEFVVQGQRPTLTLTALPERAERITAWRSGLARAATALTTSARPRRSRADVARLLKEVTDACGQPPITPW